ncbi:VOC family protein [Parenemella sanctibonifatiensis]|uniref:Bleomycin resistance protein n=1 Tax=Parenemella sanctibonifatiensis TaxID=2016505 RepID=A0A255EAF4_9ACTN|nr:VOC family protein [Parenemella sanctibonifatiensis]OYN85123.1 bleomycin resistance protein [Parenemella sanctibonifatiensis]
MTKPQLFQCLRYQDADAAIRFLTALGFTEAFVVRDEKDPAVIVHAQFRWRDNGGIMFGSTRGDGNDSSFSKAYTNLVVASDAEVDATLARALSAGGTQLSEITEPDHGGRTVTISDPEGNRWNLDSYPGE